MDNRAILEPFDRCFDEVTMSHCVITGAADGIGKALAERFGKANFSVLGIDVDQVQAAKTESELSQSGGKISFAIADLSTDAGIEKAMSAVSTGPEVDVWIQNVGINEVEKFSVTELEQQRKVIDINLSAPMVMTARLLHEGMLATEGSMVFVSSLSCFTGYPGASVYAATKDGVASYARSVSAGMASSGVHVLTVYPGPTRTEHARRYSPDNSREGMRMAPEDLADRVFRAVKRRKRFVIPGTANRLMAWMGLWLPGLTEAMMRRAILDRLP